MDTSIIRSFLVLAETLSFSKAADALYKTQSVLSRQISRFEKELGIRLFDRNSKSVSLTPAGKHYADGLKAIYENHADLLQQAAAIQSGFSGELHIATLPGQMIHYSFAGILRSFERKHPEIMVHLTACNLREQRQMLLEQKLDLVFGTNLNFKYIPQVSYETVGHAMLGVCMTAEHAAGIRAPVTFADFKDDTFILMSEYEEPNIVKIFKRHFEAVDYVPDYIVAPDMATLMLWLEVGRGVSILDETHVFSDNPYLRYVNLPALGYMDQSVIWNTANTNPCAALFKTFIQDYQPKQDT